MTGWSFLTTHARVLLTIAEDPDIRLRDIAATVGVTERRAHAIVTDLTDSDYLTKHRVGRRNRYEIQSQRRVNDDVIELTIGDVLDLLTRTSDAT
jgi:DNA-binding MarR family transcriptional regulator